jgi:hypothetical protein
VEEDVQRSLREDVEARIWPKAAAKGRTALTRDFQRPSSADEGVEGRPAATLQAVMGLPEAAGGDLPRGEEARE